MYNLKSPADDPRISEQSIYLLRGRVGCDVKIFGLSTEQKISNAAANQVSGESALRQPLGHLQCIFIEIASIETGRLCCLIAQIKRLSRNDDGVTNTECADNGSSKKKGKPKFSL